MKVALKLFLIGILLTSCNAPKVVYDFDSNVNFEEYQSYQLFPDFKTGLSQLDDKRIINSLSVNMQKKGFQISESNPDMYVNVYTEEFQEQNPNSIGVGVGGGGNVGFGISGGIPIGGPKDYMHIIIDFIDVKQDALIWKAEIDTKFNKNANPETRQKLFDKVITKALTKYPPEK
ncbi:DUF4136 domain-containing protein [Zunongwangia sp.]|uniref:DUF4136 domain-containing protein n=1 Tax=Zunongwangia sp. TaxID=1965325 RepID=UPI003AA97836